MTTKDVGADYQHDVWLPFQLLSISGIDSKLGLIMIRPSLHLAADQLVLDPPPVIKHKSDMRQFFEFFNIRLPLSFSTEKWYSTYLCPGER